MLSVLGSPTWQPGHYVVPSVVGATLKDAAGRVEAAGALESTGERFAPEGDGRPLCHGAARVRVDRAGGYLGDCWATVELAANALFTDQGEHARGIDRRSEWARSWLNHAPSRLSERRGWDSNPRMTLTAIAGFQDVISGQRTVGTGLQDRVGVAQSCPVLGDQCQFGASCARDPPPSCAETAIEGSQFRLAA
jgi:hypothetical protein